MPLRGEAANRPTYVDHSRIGVGSNELVHCSHAVLGARCVQKTVPIGPDGADFAEPRLLEALDHPHITPVREAQFDPQRDNSITFVMPWYSGGSVAEALRDGHSFSLHESIGVVRNVLDALEYVHVVHKHLHRDIKTSNVLLDEARSAGYLADFERAGPMDDAGEASAVRATIFYMAPELNITQRHTRPADLYGVGMLLFEMLNGRFQWEEFVPQATEERIASGRRSFADRLVAPTSFAPHVPRALVRITRKAMDRDPARRYQTASSFLAELNRVQVIDWRCTEADDLEGTWLGTWPPNRRRSRRDRYRVTARRLAGGADRGCLRLVAETQEPDSISWRRFRVPDATVDDEEGLRQFFAEVSARAAQRRPA